MNNDTKYSIIMTTTGNEEQAEELAKKILASKLAACIQVQNIKSFYTWKNEQCSDPECLLLIKSRSDLFDSLRSFILKNHSYETPEIIQVPIIDGHAGYLSWIDEVTNA